VTRNSVIYLQSCINPVIRKIEIFIISSCQNTGTFSYNSIKNCIISSKSIKKPAYHKLFTLGSIKRDIINCIQLLFIALSHTYGRCFDVIPLYNAETNPTVVSADSDANSGQPPGGSQHKGVCWHDD